MADISGSKGELSVPSLKIYLKPSLFLSLKVKHIWPGIQEFLNIYCQFSV